MGLCSRKTGRDATNFRINSPHGKHVFIMGYRVQGKGRLGSFMKSRFWLAISVLLLGCLPSFAASRPDRTQFGHDIHIQPGEQTAEVTCFNCSIYFAGKAAGDVTAIHGNVVIESGAEVAGDVTAIWGNV